MAVKARGAARLATDRFASETSAVKSLVAEHERQFREILEHCPAALNVVDEDGRLLFHNARLRKLMGYDEDELHLFDTKRFWHDLDHRARIIATLRERGGELLNEEAVWRTKQGELVNVLVSYAATAQGT